MRTTTDAIANTSGLGHGEFVRIPRVAHLTPPSPQRSRIRRSERLVISLLCQPRPQLDNTLELPDPDVYVPVTDNEFYTGYR